MKVAENVVSLIQPVAGEPWVAQLKDRSCLPLTGELKPDRPLVFGRFGLPRRVAVGGEFWVKSPKSYTYFRDKSGGVRDAVLMKDDETPEAYESRIKAYSDSRSNGSQTNVF